MVTGPVMVAVTRVLPYVINVTGQAWHPVGMAVYVSGPQTSAMAKLTALMALTSPPGRAACTARSP